MILNVQYINNGGRNCLELVHTDNSSSLLGGCGAESGFFRFYKTTKGFSSAVAEMLLFSVASVHGLKLIGGTSLFTCSSLCASWLVVAVGSNGCLRIK